MSVNCQLHLVADELFYQNVGQKDERRTVRIMKDVIRGADAVFRSTDFDQVWLAGRLDGVGDNIGFLVTNITIIKTRQQSFMPDNTDNDHLTYLENFSRLDQSAYCLAVAFTYREFEQGVYVNEEAAIFSFNTLAITLLTHGQRRSLDMAVRTLTHEFGHSFGSTHDEGTGSSCGQVGVSRGGTFLMNHYSTSGDMPNNRLFSPCSRGLMYPVIVKNGNCLQRYSGNRCGDGVVGDSEECDCGTSGSVCEQHGMEDCLCVHSGPARCKLCCKTPGGSDFDCTPADVLGIRGKDNTSIYLPTFEPCKGPPFGFCDKRRQCVPHLDLASSIFAKDREGLFARWFLNHWPYLLNLLGLLIIGVITFNVCGDQNSKDAHVTAVRYGKVLSFFSICQEEKRRYHQNIRLCRLVFGRFQAKLLTTNLTQTLTEAVGRLRAFFPTCPLSHLLTTITSSTSEDVAVRILLAQGYAMRQFTRQPGDTPKTAQNDI
nr:hypothetical protein BaRGS_029779 [Batillaria attramentaria]